VDELTTSEAMTRDALAILANIYIRFGRAGEAAAVFGAVAQLDADPGWALRARCVALLRADRHAEAATEARRLLECRMDDQDRMPLLHVLARACWALGRTEEAREAHREATSLAAVSLSRGTLAGVRS
jgi:Flp pilus assembly protein TadD